MVVTFNCRLMIVLRILGRTWVYVRGIMAKPWLRKIGSAMDFDPRPILRSKVLSRPNVLFWSTVCRTGWRSKSTCAPNFPQEGVSPYPLPPNLYEYTRTNSQKINSSQSIIYNQICWPEKFQVSILIERIILKPSNLLCIIMRLVSKEIKLTLYSHNMQYTNIRTLYEFILCVNCSISTLFNVIIF